MIANKIRAIQSDAYGCGSVKEAAAKLAEDWSVDVLTLLVAVARMASIHIPRAKPIEGDLVVEVSKFGDPDPDAIGFLQGHGEAAYEPDGSGPTRIVWDVRPLSGKGGIAPGVQRWENADFVVVPVPPCWEQIVQRLRDQILPRDGATPQ
jgi:hypothetical protein